MKILGRTLKFVLVLSMAVSISQSLFAQESNIPERKTVRVGYFIGEGFQERSTLDGHRSGYGYEYLQTIAYYTGWKYEYIEASWAKCLEMIASGQIDILAQVSKTAERQKIMLYADHPMGYEEYYLYTLPTKMEIRSDDLSTLEGKNIGVNAGSYQCITFREWCKENNVHCNIIESEIEDIRIQNFFNGELDAIVDNDFYLDQGYIPVYKIGKSDYFMCVTPSRRDIYDELNKAQEKLFENTPLYIEKLQSIYFPKETIAKTLTVRELNWLKRRGKNQDKIKFGYTDEYLPYCTFNEETGKMEGAITILIDSDRDCSLPQPRRALRSGSTKQSRRLLSVLQQTLAVGRT